MISVDLACETETSTYRNRTAPPTALSTGPLTHSPRPIQAQSSSAAITSSQVLISAVLLRATGLGGFKEHAPELEQSVTT